MARIFNGEFGCGSSAKDSLDCAARIRDFNVAGFANLPSIVRMNFAANLGVDSPKDSPRFAANIQKRFAKTPSATRFAAHTTIASRAPKWDEKQGCRRKDPYFGLVKMRRFALAG